jgi:Na+-driven multidrug efflux pump
VLSALGAIIYLLAEPMFFLFTGGRQPGVAVEGVPLLQIVAFAMPALATINVLNGSLRGAGDTRWPWAFVLVGYVLIRLPLTYLLATPEPQGGLGWGLYGAWVAMFADLTVRAVLVAARFLQGGWRTARV